MGNDRAESEPSLQELLPDWTESGYGSNNWVVIGKRAPLLRGGTGHGALSP